MKIKNIICDIEGTTSSISFVHKVLFPLAYDAMETFIKTNANNPELQSDMEKFKSTATTHLSKKIENITNEDVIQLLKDFIKKDIKDTFLKQVQGLIWKESFEKGTIKGHLYRDVLPAFKKWKQMGIILSIYSSGSVQAQKLYFKYSDSGDLSPFISYYFDTTTGGKKDTLSYTKITQKLDAEPEEILFISDVPEELIAAKTAKLQTLLAVRENSPLQSDEFKIIRSFDEINFLT